MMKIWVGGYIPISMMNHGYVNKPSPSFASIIAGGFCGDVRGKHSRDDLSVIGHWCFSSE